jgi:hypothetical protein
MERAVGIESFLRQGLTNSRLGNSTVYALAQQVPHESRWSPPSGRVSRRILDREPTVIKQPVRIEPGQRLIYCAWRMLFLDQTAPEVAASPPARCQSAHPRTAGRLHIRELL